MGDIGGDIEKDMGIVLLLSLLTIPTVIANALTKDYRLIALWSAIVQSGDSP